MMASMPGGNTGWETDIENTPKKEITRRIIITPPNSNNYRDAAERSVSGIRASALNRPTEQAKLQVNGCRIQGICGPSTAARGRPTDFSRPLH
jgi:hypothetical protein